MVWLGADLEPGEAGHSQSGVGKNLADGQFVVLGVVLLEQGHLLEERVDPALDDLGQCRFRLAFVLRDLGDDPALGLDGFGWDVLTREVLGVGERDVLGDAARGLCIGTGVADDNADLRRQVLAGLVQVNRERLAGDGSDAAQFELLADDGGLVADQVGDSLVSGRGGQAFLDGGRAGCGDRIQDLLRQGNELLTLGDEVGLAGEFDHERGVADDRGGHEALRGGPVGALGVALCTLETQDFDGLLHVAIGFDEGVLGVDHAGAEALAQGLDGFECDVCHPWVPYLVSSAGASTAATSSGAASTGAASPATCSAATFSAATRTVSAEDCSGVASVAAASGACSSSASHAARGSTSASGLAWRWMRPSAAASAMMRVNRPTERMASSLPGIGYWTSSGSQFVSRIAMTGMPSLRASSMARCSLLVSTTHSADGVFVMLRIPPRLLCSLMSSRFLISISFFVKPLLAVSSKSSSSSSFMRARRLETVWKLVRRPPSQRWLT